MSESLPVFVPVALGHAAGHVVELVLRRLEELSGQLAVVEDLVDVEAGTKTWISVQVA